MALDLDKAQGVDDPLGLQQRVSSLSKPGDVGTPNDQLQLLMIEPAQKLIVEPIPEDPTINLEERLPYPLGCRPGSLLVRRERGGIVEQAFKPLQLFPSIAHGYEITMEIFSLSDLDK